MLPLKGLKVVDFGQGIAGPYAAMLMGDAGAEVIKVEPPRGDWGRTLGSPLGASESATFLSVNRNKRSMVVDLSRPEGSRVAAKLIGDADVLIQSFRPKVMARYGLDYDSVSHTRPNLIYCSISGYGASGPCADLPAGDSTMQAYGGLMSIVGEDGAPPMRVGNVVSDMLAGMNAFHGILLALLNRRMEPSGVHVEVSLLSSLIAFQAPVFYEYLVSGTPPARTGNTHPLLAPSGLFEAADGALVFSVLAHQWTAFCEFFDFVSLANDPRFADNKTRVMNHRALMDLLRPRFRQEPRSAILEKLRACDVPCAPVNDFPAIVADPQVAATGLLQQVLHPSLGKIPSICNPVSINGKAAVQGHVPVLGEHTDAILREIGYGNEEIGRFLDDGVVYAAIEGEHSRS